MLLKLPRVRLPSWPVKANTTTSTMGATTKMAIHTT